MLLTTESKIQFIICLLSFINFIPIILQYHYPTESVDDNTEDLDLQLKHSYNVRAAFACSIAVMGPFILEALFDYITKDLERLNNVYWNKSLRNSLICFIIPDIYILGMNNISVYTEL